MRSKQEQIIIGTAILLIGLLLIFQNSILVSAGTVIFLSLGFVFSLLYVTKRKSWALVLGAFFLYIWVTGFILNNFDQIRFIAAIREGIVISAGLVIVGLVFIILFFHKNKTGLLIPGSVITSWGINMMIRAVWPFFESFGLYLVLSGAFYFIYAQGKYFIGKWPLYACFIFLILTVSRIVFTLAESF